MFMDLGMNERDFTNVLSLFSRARDKFDRIGRHDKAKDCENAIALTQEIALVLSTDQPPGI
jgi:hypothetical protein